MKSDEKLLSRALMSGWIFGVLGVAAGLAYVAAGLESHSLAVLLGPLPYLFGAMALASAGYEFLQVRRVKPVLGVAGIGLASIAVVPLFWGFVLIMIVSILVVAIANPSP